MKILFAVVAVAIIAALVFADRRWRRWMVARQRERQNEAGNESHDDSRGSR